MTNHPIKQITDILSACGCKPAAQVNANGDIIIKVNAPTIPANDPPTLGDFNDPVTAFCEMD